MRGKRQAMPFAIPMVWREPQDHVRDCYFCLTKVRGVSYKKRKSIIYPSLPSAIRPVLHDESLPIPPAPSAVILSDSSDSDVEKDTAMENDTSFEAPESGEPHLIRQTEMNDLVRDLQLSKNQAELLGSRLQGWNLLATDTKVSLYRTRDVELRKFFIKVESLCYCSDINGLFEALGYQHDPNEWRLFIDSSKLSLKAVLLHNGNLLPSLPIGHAVGLKESYETMQLLLKSVEYERYLWYICADLKVVALLTGLQLGYTKYCCFLCEWDSRNRAVHYTIKDWPSRQQYIPGQKKSRINR
jgi:hypothetical protein